MNFVVNGIKWNLIFVDVNSPLLTRSDGSKTVGTTDNNTKTVYLSEKLKGKFLLKVICHEVTHVYMFSYGVLLNRKQEELFANILSDYGRDITETANYIYESTKGICYDRNKSKRA